MMQPSPTTPCPHPCRMLEPLDRELLLICLQRACVFARMSPENKQDLCELLGSGIASIPDW